MISNSKVFNLNLQIFLRTFFLLSSTLLVLFFSTADAQSKQIDSKPSIPVLRHSNTVKSITRTQKKTFQMDLDYKFLSPSKIKQQDILQTNQNTATNKQENQLESKNSDKIVDNKETLGFKTLENESAKRNSIATNQTLVPNATTLSIPKLGIFNSTLNEGSLRNIPDIDNKLLYGAVLENQVSNSPCSIGHSYIYGHSEPAESWQNAYPGVRIFANLHTLGIGDRIEIKTKTGQSCVYELVRWDQVETSQNQTLSADQLNFVFNPGEGINLTIQTCKLGSATVRNLLRARLIN